MEQEHAEWMWLYARISVPSGADNLQATADLGLFSAVLPRRSFMRPCHHTKTKADIGLAKVIADLTEKGHVPCVPLSEHQPYDLVVVTRSGVVAKVQVKYASLKANGTIDIRYRRSWSDSRGTYSTPYGHDEFDW